MDIPLIIFSALILIFAVRGYKNGFLNVSSKLASYLIAYVMAYSYAKPVSLFLQSILPVNGLISYLIAGGLLFVVATIISSLIFNFLAKLLYDNTHVGKLSAIGGCLLGGGVGILFGFFSVWVYTTFQDLYVAKHATEKIAGSQFQQYAKGLSTKAINLLASGISDNPDINHISSALITNPVENIERYKRINENGKFKNLFENDLSKNALNNLNPNQLIETNSFKELTNDPDFIALTQEFNLPKDPKQMQQEVADKLTTVWAQINQVKLDPQFIAITEDPEIKKQIQDKNILGLLNNPKTDELINIVTSAKIPQLNYQTTSTTKIINDFTSKQNGLNKQPEDKSVAIYKWIDENGKVHYSDKPLDD